MTTDHASTFAAGSWHCSVDAPVIAVGGGMVAAEGGAGPLLREPVPVFESTPGSLS
ncbi:MAG: hypothetical protein ACYDGY_05370 [Acidimicrobiales bacterium]